MHQPPCGRGDIGKSIPDGVECVGGESGGIHRAVERAGAERERAGRLPGGEVHGIHRWSRIFDGDVYGLHAENAGSHQGF